MYLDSPSSETLLNQSDPVHGSLLSFSQPSILLNSSSVKLHRLSTSCTLFPPNVLQPILYFFPIRLRPSSPVLVRSLNARFAHALLIMSERNVATQNPFQTLPFEVRANILSSIPDLVSLHSLHNISPHVALFLHEKITLSVVFESILSPLHSTNPLHDSHHHPHISDSTQHQSSTNKLGRIQQSVQRMAASASAHSAWIRRYCSSTNTTPSILRKRKSLETHRYRSRIRGFLLIPAWLVDGRELVNSLCSYCRLRRRCIVGDDHVHIKAICVPFAAKASNTNMDSTVLIPICASWWTRQRQLMEVLSSQAFHQFIALDVLKTIYGSLLEIEVDDFLVI
jgi:hypothetical protein